MRNQFFKSLEWKWNIENSWYPNFETAFLVPCTLFAFTGVCPVLACVSAFMFFESPYSTRSPGLIVVYNAVQLSLPMFSNYLALAPYSPAWSYFSQGWRKVWKWGGGTVLPYWGLRWRFWMQSVKVATENLTFLKWDSFPMLIYALKTI